MMTRNRNNNLPEYMRIITGLISGMLFTYFMHRLSECLILGRTTDFNRSSYHFAHDAKQSAEFEHGRLGITKCIDDDKDERIIFIFKLYRYTYLQRACLSTKTFTRSMFARASTVLKSSKNG